MDHPTLILSSRYTDDAQLLWRAATARGWNVERLVGWKLAPTTTRKPPFVVYVEALIGPLIADQLGVVLLEPSLEWLSLLPREYAGREVVLTTMARARCGPFPRFIKPPLDKSFQARVYHGNDLPDVAGDTAVYTGDVVRWRSEFRCFALNGTVRACSLYARHGEMQHANGYHSEAAELNEARAFAEGVLRHAEGGLPKAVVLDVGVIEGHGWAVVEANGAWGAGLYGCDPDAVLDVVRHATAPADAIDR